MKPICLLLFFSLFINAAHGRLIYENKGQVNSEDVIFYTTFQRWNIYFLEDRISFVKSETEIHTDRNKDEKRSIRWDLIPQWSNVKLIAGKKTTVISNYILNSRLFQAESFESITYSTPEFDIVFYSDEDNGLKYDIVSHIKNKSGTRKIIFRTEGCSSVEKTNESLYFNTELGRTKINIPLAYSDSRNGTNITRRNVEIHSSVNGDSFSYEFETLPEDENIIIDPWATFAGGTDEDEAYGSAFDTSGNIYVSGYCSSLDFPVTTGVVQTTFNGIYDSFILKLTPTGQQIWSTYYGGTNNDFGNKIVVNSRNQPILTGYTYSSDLMVSSTGVFSSTFSGVFDAFILFLNSDGTFDKATFYGGTGGEFVTDMDIRNDELVIGGFTSSSDLPVISGAYQNTMGGALDIFVATFDSTANRIWDTYYGGTDSEDAHSVSYDPFGNIVICGDTYSTNFPISTNAYQNTYTAGSDICLVKFDPNGQRIWATYFGSNVNEDAEAIDTDEFGNIYFAGFTTGNGLPVTPGLFQDTHTGDRDLILCSFSPGGNLRWLTLAGGTAWDFPRSIDVNQGGNISITGESYSTDFPEFGDTLQSGNNGNSDVVYLVCDSLGSVSLSTLWGGSGSESGQSVSFDGLSKTVIAGITSSADLDVDSDIFQTDIAGQNDAFVKVLDSTAGVFLANPIYLSHQNDFLLFPNPVNQELILTNIIPAEYLVSIYGMNGELIFQQKQRIEGQIRITELGNITSGSYLISLQSETKFYRQKFIKF